MPVVYIYGVISNPHGFIQEESRIKKEASPTYPSTRQTSPTATDLVQELTSKSKDSLSREIVEEIIQTLSKKFLPGTGGVSPAPLKEPAATERISKIFCSISEPIPLLNSFKPTPSPGARH